LKAFFELSCNIDILGSPRITVSKGKYDTSDERVIRRLRGYPGVTLLRTESENPPIFAGGELEGTYRRAPPEVEVKTWPGGVSFKEKRPIGGRVADTD
jgi:hypothetical protein